MSRYIDADNFIEWLDVGHLRSPSEICYCEGDVKTMIDMQPTADVVEVVRCKDCVHSGEYDIPCVQGLWCNKLDSSAHENHYCSYGEMRENGN